jgi:hypothetical protein
MLKQTQYAANAAVERDNQGHVWRVQAQGEDLRGDDKAQRAVGINQSGSYFRFVIW